MNAEIVTTAPINLFKQLVATGQERTARAEWYKKEVGHLYLIRIDQISGKSSVIKDSFLKIGMSSQMDVHSRFNLMPRCFIITVIEDIVLPLEEVRSLEKRIHNHCRDFRYIPKHKRWGGKTECFNLNLMTEFSSLADMITSLKPLPEATKERPMYSL